MPASVQWEQTARVTLSLEPVVEHLCQLGAQAAVFYNDDTTMRIAAVRKEIKAEKNPKRTGIFTTGIVCDELEAGGRSIRIQRHKAWSEPVLEKLRKEFQESMDQKKVEPNSALGGAIAYLLDRWESLSAAASARAP